MDVGVLLNTIWDLINSPIGISVVAGALLWALNKLYAAKPAWAAYEGTIVSGIKFAEKMVPDDTPNKASTKLNTAINYVLKVYENTNKGKKPSKKLRDSIVQGIQLKHESLEEKGTLKPPLPEAKTMKPHLPKEEKKK